MTVSIDVDLDALDAKMEIANLKLMLESLGEDMDFDLDLDGDLGDTLDDLSDTMENLSESFNADLNETIDRLEGLEFDDIRVIRGDGDSGGDTGSDSGDYTPSARQFYRNDPFDDDRGKGSSINQALRQFHRNLQDSGDAFDIAETRIDTRSYRESITKNIGSDRFRGRSYRFAGGVNSMAALREAFPFSGSENEGGAFSGLDGKFRKIRRGVNGVNNSVRDAIPNMRMWWSLIAAAIPALGAMAVQALGVAAALGAVAVAGASMVGIGLLGHGDTMAESFRNAQQELGELKQGLFDSFEPTADLFSGIQSEFFDFVPGQMDKIARSMEGLTVFEDDLFSGFRGLTTFIADLFDVIVDNEEIVSDLANTFGSIIATNIVDLFEWLLQTASENKQMLIELGSVFRNVALGLYEIFVTIARAITMLDLFFVLFKYIGQLLNNSLVSGMTSILVLMFILVSVGGALYSAFMSIGLAIMSTTIPAITSLMASLQATIFTFLTGQAMAYGLAHAISTVTAAILTLAAVSGIGLLISGVGLAASRGMRDQIGQDMPMGSSQSSGQTTIINEGDNVNVDIAKADNPSMEKFRDMRSTGGTRGPTGGSYTSD